MRDNLNVVGQASIYAARPEALLQSVLYGLSHRPLERNPWDSQWARQPEGDVLVGYVRAPQRPSTVPSASRVDVLALVASPQNKKSYEALGLPASWIPLTEIADDDQIVQTLMQPSGSAIKERYVFETVLGFLEEDGSQGLRLIQNVLSKGESVPQPTRYFLPMVLGYVRNENIRVACRAMLYGFRHNPDGAIRAGAKDGIDYLDSV